ncbi:sigma 54-interacting transcriptional regulator [Peribacillus sp. SCS-155]|uniref:sigma 54-interacting transcriptional regulator n=1 Tax=Peribacillus sedimenti TaxID=3115297 RepID=UPI003905B551
MQKITLIVNKNNGLHVRMIASFISKLQHLIQDSETLKSIYIQYKNKQVQVTNFLSLVSLRVGKGEAFDLIFKKGVEPSILVEIKAFFAEKEKENAIEAETDRLLIENSDILYEGIAKMPNGMVVVNRDNIITYVNEAATQLLEKPLEALVNYRADDVIPGSRLLQVMDSGNTVFAEKQQIHTRTLLVNRAPLFFENKVVGAVAIFQDISDIEKISLELQKEKELQERLNLVLESVSDLIGLTDESGSFTYMNEQMEELLASLGIKGTIFGLIGRQEWKKIKRTRLPLIKAMNTINKNVYAMKMMPIVLHNCFKGTVVSLSPYLELKSLLDRLDVMTERTLYLEKELSKHVGLDDAFQAIVGNSETLLESLSIANKVSKTDSTVLITGESGTGKELVARAVHESSNRKLAPFIRVNCAALPPSLIESELFGHEKGAFTGAYKARKGKFELAQGGTIFLDEIGDLNFDAQVKLLRVLQEKEIERVGGNQIIFLDVRVIAATNQNLQNLVKKGHFREDLYYRLNVIPVHLPPLRSRKDDIPLLADHFREMYNERLGKNIKGYHPGFLEVMGGYEWPGNIRQLQNVMERSMTLSEDSILRTNDLPQYIISSQDGEGSFELIKKDEILTLNQYERQVFSHAAPYYPSYNQLAQALGITHKTAAQKLRKYGIEHLLGKKYQHL